MWINGPSLPARRFLYPHALLDDLFRINLQRALVDPIGRGTSLVRRQGPPKCTHFAGPWR